MLKVNFQRSYLVSDSKREVEEEDLMLANVPFFFIGYFLIDSEETTKKIKLIQIHKLFNNKNLPLQILLFQLRLL